MTALTARRKELRLRWRETPESLDSIARKTQGHPIRYGDHYLLTGWYYNGINRDGWYASIYEKLDDESMGPETDLGLAEISPEFFPDEGHAIEWAINMIK